VRQGSSPAEAELSPELLLHAYSFGVFPMAEHRDDPDIFWVDPKRRGVLPLEQFHISRSLRRRMQKPDVRATMNQNFTAVLMACAARSETWINAELADLYTQLHFSGHAHSVEIWYGKELAGGIYGVTLGSAFFGESMFSNQANGSKISLAVLTRHLLDCGYTLFDTQFISPHLSSLGATEIPRAEYQKRLKAALARNCRMDALPLLQPQDVIQRMTQTS
jgi:leucyl/phenylalanyl-tRNA--protein transferase